MEEDRIFINDGPRSIPSLLRAPHRDLYTQQLRRGLNGVKLCHRGGIIRETKNSCETTIG
jgi:hypothetical protein